MAKTRLGQSGIPSRPYDGFTSKAPLPKGEGPFTRHTTIGIMGKRVVFSPKSSDGKGAGHFTRHTTMGIMGQPVEFVAKESPEGKGQGPFTQHTVMGIMGKRRVFSLKTQLEETTPGQGGRQYTPEEIEGLEAIWGAVKGDYEFEFEPTVQEIEDISLIIAIDEATEKNTYYTI